MCIHRVYFAVLVWFCLTIPTYQTGFCQQNHRPRETRTFSARYQHTIEVLSSSVKSHVRNWKMGTLQWINTYHSGKGKFIFKNWHFLSLSLSLSLSLFQWLIFSFLIFNNCPISLKYRSYMHSKYTIHSVQRMYKFNDVRFKISLKKDIVSYKIRKSTNPTQMIIHPNPPWFFFCHCLWRSPSFVPEIRTQFWSHVLAELQHQKAMDGHGLDTNSPKSWLSTMIEIEYLFRFLFVQFMFFMSWNLLSAPGMVLIRYQRLVWSTSIPRYCAVTTLVFWLSGDLWKTHAGNSSFWFRVVDLALNLPKMYRGQICNLVILSA